jgi:Tfp pilus assembly protein PilX
MIMRAWLQYLGDESGMALVAALLMMASLTAIGAFSANVTTGNEEIAGNLRASKQAFYLAEAGLAWGRQQVKASTAAPPLPAGSTQTLSPGIYTTTFPAITPTISGALSYTVVVRSTGTVGTASKTLETLITKTYSIGDAAIAMRGAQANSGFTGNAFTIDGNDYAYDSATGNWDATGNMTLGISVPDTTLQTQVVSALSAEQQNNITGLGGAPSVGVSTSLPSDSISSLADALCNATPAANQQTIASGTTVSIGGNTTWGTRSSPQIHCVTGSGTPSNPATLDIGGTFTGAGILVVRGAQLTASGAFHFEGLIIDNGSDVGFTVKGGGNKDVYGTVMVNELTIDPQDELDAQGAVHIRYSSSSLAMASQLFSPAAWQAVLPVSPSGVQQLSWREVNQ